MEYFVPCSRSYVSSISSHLRFVPRGLTVASGHKIQPLPGWPVPLKKTPRFGRAKKMEAEKIIERQNKTKQLSFQYFDNSDPISFPAIVYSPSPPRLRRETIARRHVNKIGRGSFILLVPRHSSSKLCRRLGGELVPPFGSTLARFCAWALKRTLQTS